MSPRIRVERQQLASFCERWKIARLELFGSILRDDFREDSDVDVLVTYRPDAAWSLMDTIVIQDELSALLGRSVDLVSRPAVEKSYNWVRRHAILDATQVLHAAG